MSPFGGHARELGAEHLPCPHANGCEMFNLLREAGTLKTWQIRYCAGDYRSCARHQLAREGKPVPQGLLPSGQLLRFAGKGG